MLVVGGLVLLATVVFMLRGGRGTVGGGERESVRDALWVRNYLTNLQSGGVNEMAVESVRLSKDAVIPVLVEEMGVRPPTMARDLSERVERILARFASVQRPRRVPDGYRAAATWALATIYRGPREEGYRAATAEEAKMLLPVMANALYDPAVMVRVNAAGALGAFGVEREDALALCEVALADEEWMVRAAVLDSMMALGQSDLKGESIERMREMLRDGHPEVRRRARGILVKAGVPVPEGEEEEWVSASPNVFE